MTQQAAFAPSVHQARSLEDMGTIHDPDCAAVVIARPYPAEVATWLAALPPAQLPTTREILRPDAIADGVRRACAQAQTPDSPARDWLVADIAALARRFAEVMGTGYLRLRLDAVSTNACRKFHIDAVTARLVCTYRGEATQYGMTPDRGDPDQICQTPTGAPLVLRGTRSPVQAEGQLVHRSPPIEGTGETRLLLVLDPVTDPQAESF